jgi:hypothetical protein
VGQCFLHCLVNTQKQARRVSLCAPIVNHGLFRQCIVGKHWDMENIKKCYTGKLPLIFNEIISPIVRLRLGDSHNQMFEFMFKMLPIKRPVFYPQICGRKSITLKP